MLKRAFLAICVSAVCFCSNGEERLMSSRPPSPDEITAELNKNKKELHTLDPKNSRWDAYKIGVNGDKAPFVVRDDYAVLQYGKAWNFKNGMPVNLKPKRNVSNFRIENGKLEFTTGENAEIAWGDGYHKQECIGKNWFRHICPIFVEIKIKQSLPKSDWTFSFPNTMSAHGSGTRKAFHLVGTDWQTVNLKLGISNDVIRALFLKTKQAGNHVEIESVSVYTPQLTRLYQKEIELRDEPESANFCCCAGPSYKISINGVPVCREERSRRMYGILNSYDDMGKYFKKGKNIIQVEAETIDWSRHVDEMIFAGMVFDKAGNSYSLKSDASWKARYISPTGASTPSAWKPVKLLAKVTGHFGQNGQPGGAFYLNPPRFGRVKQKPDGREQPIFRDSENITFDISVFATGLKSNFDLKCRVMDALDNDKELSNITLLSDAKPEKTSTILSFKAPHSGVYNFSVDLIEKNSGELIENNLFEAVSVGLIKQREVVIDTPRAGLDLKLIDEIDCANDFKRPMVCATQNGELKSAKIIEKPFGKYLVTPDETYSFISWNTEFADWKKPHLIEMDYPDDANRIIGLDVSYNSYFKRLACDWGDRNYTACASGVYTGFQNRPSGGMRTLRAVFYPKMAVGTVTVINNYNDMEGAGCAYNLSPFNKTPDPLKNPAAVSKIRIYEIQNELPALKIFSKRSRLTGVHTERLSILPNNFYNGELDANFIDGQDLSHFKFHGFYKAWYITSENFIRYMRFCGENMFIAGMEMYFQTTCYPSSNPDRAAKLMFQEDAAALLGEMFAANDMTLLLGIEYSGPAILNRKNRMATVEEIAQGARTYSAINANGRPVRGWNTITNINDKEVKDDFLFMIDELCERYKNNPGIKGLFLQEQCGAFLPSIPFNFHSGIDPLDSDYSDTTISLFEKETGITIPVDAKDPKRFSKRHDWLLANKKREWMDWRVRDIFEINRQAADIVKKIAPSWTTYIMHNFKHDAVSKLGLTADEFQRRTGFYPPMYKNPDFCVGRVYPECVRFECEHHDTWLNSGAYFETPEVSAMFNDGMEKTAIQIGPQFVEKQLKLPKMDGNRQWFWVDLFNATYSEPAGENLLKLNNRVLLRETPYLIAQFWSDVNMPCGSEFERGLFNRAFTVIPIGDYKNLEGSGLDDNTVIRAAGSNFYIINPLPCELAVSLKPEGASVLTDLSSGEKFKLEDGAFKITLDANGLRTFALDKGHLISASSKCPRSAALEYETRAKKIITATASFKERIKDGTISSFLKPDAEKLIGFADRLERELAKGQFGKIRLELDSFTLRKTLSDLDRLLSSVEWRVIGPFDNNERKGFERVFDVEKDLLKGAPEMEYPGIAGTTAKWKNLSSEKSGIIDLSSFYGGNRDHQIAYAKTFAFSPVETPVELLLGSDDGMKVWVNGKEVFAIKPPGRSLTPGENRANAALKKGWNQIIVKAENNIGGWGFSLEVRDTNGEKIPGLRFNPNPRSN